jgi:hypothetical protein
VSIKLKPYPSPAQVFGRQVATNPVEAEALSLDAAIRAAMAHPVRDDQSRLMVDHPPVSTAALSIVMAKLTKGDHWDLLTTREGRYYLEDLGERD